MSYDPGSSPYMSPMGSGDSNQFALGKVAAPAIALIVVGAINGLLGVINIVQGVAVLGVAMPPPPPEVQNDPNALQMYNLATSMAGPGYIVAGLLTMLFAGLIVFGGIKMKGLQSRGLAMTGSILAMLPCGCCIIGLPIGIWSLVTLNNAEVKSAFR